MRQTFIVEEIACSQCGIIVYGVGELPKPYTCDYCIMQNEYVVPFEEPR